MKPLMKPLRSKAGQDKTLPASREVKLQGKNYPSCQFAAMIVAKAS